jgi:hypothetical protein
MEQGAKNMERKLQLVPNQKAIRIMTKEKCDKDNLYVCINLEAIEAAMAALDGNCFKLWLYLAKNQSGYEFGLSQKDCEKYGLKKDAYQRAVNVLIEKGYLTEIELYPNLVGYAFTEKPATGCRKNQLPVDGKTGYRSPEKPARNNTNNTIYYNNNTGADSVKAESAIVGANAPTEQKVKDKDIDLSVGEKAEGNRKLHELKARGVDCIEQLKTFEKEGYSKRACYDWLMAQ